MLRQAPTMLLGSVPIPFPADITGRLLPCMLRQVGGAGHGVPLRAQRHHARPLPSARFHPSESKRDGWSAYAARVECESGALERFVTLLVDPGGITALAAGGCCGQ